MLGEDLAQNELFELNVSLAIFCTFREKFDQNYTLGQVSSITLIKTINFVTV